MKKNILAIVSLAMLFGSASCSAQGEISLPKPHFDLKTTMMETLYNRHSTREFSDKQITDGDLATVLWAATGVNRDKEKKLTVPSAMNAQDILVYVVRPDGAYLYKPDTNSLLRVSEKDLRSLVAGRQKFAAEAPVSLVLVSNHNKFAEQVPRDMKVRLGAVDAGYVSENICLICSALSINTVPRMTMDTEALRKELKLDDNYDFVLNSQLGYPKQ